MSSLVTLLGLLLTSFTVNTSDIYPNEISVLGKSQLPGNFAQCSLAPKLNWSEQKTAFVATILGNIKAQFPQLFHKVRSRVNRICLQKYPLTDNQKIYAEAQTVGCGRECYLAINDDLFFDSAIDQISKRPVT